MADIKPIVAGPSQFQQLQAGDYLVGNTPSAGDNSTRLATTAYVDAAVAAGGGGSSQPPVFTAKDAAYTFVAGDAGLGYATTTSTARTYTVPGSVFAAGDMIWVAAKSTGQVTIAQGSGMTLRLGGSTSSGSRIVGAYGMACIYFISPTVAAVYGSGVG